MKFNIDRRSAGVEASRMKLPDWAGRAQKMLPGSAGTVIDKISGLDEDELRVRGLSTNQDSSSFDSSGLMGSGLYDEPVSLDSNTLRDWARGEVPVEDEPDCADWMVPVQAQVVHMKARANEYDRAGSSLSVAAGDPYVPGVSNGKMAFSSEEASTIQDRGTATIITADGRETMSLEAPGADTVITPNHLGWASATNFQEQQFAGTVMSVEELTNNPSEPIGFPKIEGNTGPLFVGHSPSRPSIINRTSVGIKSSTAQTLDFKLRSTRNYERVLRQFSQDVPKGKSTVDFRLLAAGISPMAMEINPEDGTKAVLTDYSVFP